MNPLIKRVSIALENHRERHRPSGFQFALAEGIDALNPQAWDALTKEASLFLTRPYLRVLEQAGPENLTPRYALVFDHDRPVAAVACQLVTVAPSRVAHQLTRKPAPALDRVKARILVCGNLLSWGQHAVAFAPGTDPTAVWPGIAEAIYRIRRAEKLSGRTDFVMVKDIADDDSFGIEALKRFSYRKLQTDPNMVLKLDPAWKTFDDYLAGLHSKYRKDALRIVKEVEKAGCKVELLDDVVSHAQRLHELYLEVHEAAAVKPVTIPAAYLPMLAGALGSAIRFTVIRKEGDILGFVTTIKDGETAIGYYIGFDRSKRSELPLYFRLLQCVVADSIAFGCRRLSLGRTALEPKAKLGARPAPTSVWLRHAHPIMNAIVGQTLGAVPHDEAPDRNPFKEGSQ